MPVYLKTQHTLRAKDKLRRITPNWKVQITDYIGATHVLIDIIDKINLPQAMTPLFYDYFSVATPALAVNSEVSTYIYAEIDQYIKLTQAAPLAAYSALMTGSVDFYYNAPNCISNILLSAASCVALNNITTITSKWSAATLDELEKEKISGEHHIHFTAREIHDVMTLQRQLWARKNAHIIPHMHNSAAAGMLLWINEAPQELLELIEATKLFATSNAADYTKLAKQISTRAKSLQNLQEHDLRPIFELETLINRSAGAVDWQSEYQNRVEPKLTSHNYDYIYHAAYHMFAGGQHEAYRPTTLSWKDFWDSRWQWTAAGSFHSQYNDDMKYLSKERELRNKFISAIKMPDLSFEHFYAREPALVAWASNKYEWGKMRAIYGTDFTSYVLAHYCFYNCEDTLGSSFPVGAKARPSYVSSRVDALLSTGQHYCVDFEDFNSQHSYSSMHAVLQAWLDAYRTKLDPQQYAAGLWTIKSLYNNIIHDNMGLKTSYKSKGTLMSGWRLTTFVNSVLNKIYTASMLNGSNDNVYSLHNGDDVILTLSNLKTTQVMLKQARRYNIRLSAHKSHFAGIAEFLRVDHFRGEHGQYLSRNIATMVHGRIESKKAVGALDAIEALETRMAEFVMRGGTVMTAALLRSKYYSRIADIYNSSIYTLQRAKITHAVCGGLSTRPDASLHYNIERVEKQAEVQLPHPLPGVHAYARQIQESLELTDIPIQKLVNRIYTATLGAVKLVRERVYSRVNTSIEQYKVYRGIYKAFAELNKNASLGKALMTGFTVEVAGRKNELHSLSAALKAVSNKMLYLELVI
jgi:hypothetical protein